MSGPYASLSPGLGSLNPSLVLSARLVLPFSGLPQLDLVLVDGGVEVTGPQTFVLDTISVTCTAIRVLDEVGRTGARLVGGRAGWRVQATAKQYTNVLASDVVSDAAIAAGEAVPVVATDATLPSYFRCASDVWSTCLDDIFGDAWWMDLTGTVQTAARDTSTVPSAFQCLRVDGAMGLYVLGVDVLADWLPGRSFSNDVVSGTISRVTHVLDGDSVRTEVLVG